MWSIHCFNQTCMSHLNTQKLPITPKSGKIYEINRVSVIGFRAIDKGRSAAKKCLSFFGLAPVYTWHQHTQVIKQLEKWIALFKNEQIRYIQFRENQTEFISYIQMVVFIWIRMDINLFMCTNRLKLHFLLLGYRCWC